MSHQPFGIYIHVPFCKQACSYCDFYFVTREDLKSAYVDALCNQIKLELPEFARTRTLTSIYFGGGTPSRLNSVQLERILETITRHVDVSSVKEVTLEANPDDVNKVMLQDLKSMGVNRLSMGVQSFDPALLTFMNRAHTSGEALHCLELIREIDFPSFTVDLIYGNPGQTDEALERDLHTLLQFTPPHVSAYALTIESGTRLGKAVERGRLSPVDDEIVSRHMAIVQQRLEAEGMLRYEVSNYALAGHEAMHNGNYWQHVPYIGFGPGAHSLDLRLNDQGSVVSAQRWEMERDLKRYCANTTANSETSVENRKDGLRHNIESLTSLQLAEERLIMGLRTSGGISLQDLRLTYGYELSQRQLDWITSQKAIRLSESPEPTQSTLYLSKESFALADYLILELISR
jgi:oxygen-independent coproporphyrinogen III oxidase